MDAPHRLEVNKQLLTKWMRCVTYAPLLPRIYLSQHLQQMHPHLDTNHLSLEPFTLILRYRVHGLELRVRRLPIRPAYISSLNPTHSTITVQKAKQDAQSPTGCSLIRSSEPSGMTTRITPGNWSSAGAILHHEFRDILEETSAFCISKL